MANYLPKGRERMRKLGRLGGLESGKTRKLNAFTMKMASLFSLWDTCQENGCTGEEIIEALQPLDARGGGHDDDWRCPSCHHFNSEKRRACAKCKALAPANGRLTRKALREVAEEHRNGAILRKHGL
jgi:hypothetical protein